jgi:RNA polymerase sigma-70 factor (ECF subfamily)
MPVVAPRLSEPGGELLAACRRGDRDAFAALFQQTRGYVHGVALHVTGDPAGAADVTQEVYLRLLTRLAQFDGRSGFRTWLFRIVVNAARDQLRRGRRLLPLPEGAVEQAATAPSPQTAVLAAERESRLRRRVAALSPRLREPLVLRFVAGLSYGEIGAVLGLPEGTVASRLSRALERLGRELREEGG